MNVSVNMRGESQIIETLKQLGKVDAGKALRSAIGYAAGKVAKRFRADAPERTGALSQAFNHTERIYGDTGAIRSWVGVSAKFVRKGVLEKTEWKTKAGTKVFWRVSDKKPIDYVRRIERSSKHAGWMRRTWETELPIIFASIEKDIWKKLTAFARRRAKKTR